MALIVEDGTGLSTANAYIDVAFADAYHSLRCNEGWQGVVSTKEAAIIKATEYIDRHYDFKGDRVEPGDANPAPAAPPQALAWPRTGVCHPDGIVIADNAVPVEVQRATAELALVGLSTPLDANVMDGNVIKRDETVGSVRIVEEFATDSATAASPSVPAATQLLRPLLASGGKFGPARLNRT
jgi:hypothetical protein